MFRGCAAQTEHVHHVSVQQPVPEQEAYFLLSDHRVRRYVDGPPNGLYVNDFALSRESTFRVARNRPPVVGHFILRRGP